jgi:hypothetical protein
LSSGLSGLVGPSAKVSTSQSVGTRVGTPAPRPAPSTAHADEATASLPAGDLAPSPAAAPNPRARSPLLPIALSMLLAGAIALSAVLLTERAPSHGQPESPRSQPALASSGRDQGSSVAARRASDAAASSAPVVGPRAAAEAGPPALSPATSRPARARAPAAQQRKKKAPSPPPKHFPKVPGL